MGNLVALICELTQSLLAKQIAYSEELHATVMEVSEVHWTEFYFVFEMAFFCVCCRVSLSVRQS